MNANNNTKAYTTIAIALGATGVLSLALSWTWFAWVHGTDIVENAEAWGQFGDFIGGFVGTVIAVATLIALAITVHLQATALRETQQSLSAQLKTYQLNESLKIRPILKTDWLLVRRQGEAQVDHVNWSIRNLGYGPAHIESLEVCDGDSVAGVYPNLNDGRKTKLVKFIENVIPEDLITIENARILVQRFDVNRRWLAHGDSLEIIQIKMNDRKIAKRIQRLLLDRVSITVHFRTVLGERFSTQTQLAEVQSHGP